MKSVSASLCLLALLTIAACDHGVTAPIVDDDKTPLVTVTPASLKLSAGETATLTAVVENDTTGLLSGVLWTSSAPAIASVGLGTGIVTAHVPGNATIIATSRYASTRTAAVEVLVTLPNGTEGMLVTPSNPVVAVGGTITLVASGAADFVWSTSAPAVATVSETGEVKAIAPGAALIKAVSRQDTSRYAIATVTVPFPQSFALNLMGIGPVPERLTSELTLRGDFVYTGTIGFRGFEGMTNFGNVIKIWNVSGSAPALVDSLKIDGITTVSDVQVSPDGSLLVASTEGSGGVGSIVIYSLSNPAKPALISVYRTPSIERGVHTVDMSVVNGRLYGFLQVDPGNNKSQPAAEVIVDLSDPTNGQMVFERAMGTPYVHDVFVRDGLLFTALWNDGMTIFDIGGGGLGGSPANPIQISNVRTRTGQIHNVWWYHDPGGSKKYVFLGEEGLGFGVPGQGATSSGDIHVVDISTMTAPREVAVYTLGSNTGTHNFSVDEKSGILYAAYYNGGVRAIDVRGDLETCLPSQRASYTSITGAPLCDLRKTGREVATGGATGGFYIWGVEWQGDRLYASDMGKGLVVFDVSKLRR